MSIFETLQLREIEKRRKDRVDSEGTAPLIFLNAGDIAVDTNKGGNVIDFTTESLTTRFYPFDFIQINNSSGSDLNIYINQNTNWRKLVRAGTIVKITDFKGVHSIRISKIGAGTIAANEVETTVMKQPLTDDEFRRRELFKSPIRKLISKFVGV